jgi:hypothetical protein
MSKPDAVVARSIPVGILVSVGPRRKTEKTARQKTAPRTRGPGVPWPWIATGGAACFALFLVVIAVCAAGQAPAPPVAEPVMNEAPVPKPIAMAAPNPKPKSIAQDAPAETPVPEESKIAPNPLPKPLPLEEEIILPPETPTVWIKPEPIIREEAPPAKTEVEKPKARAFREDVDLSVFANCKQIGSNILFVKDPPEAFKRARAEKKLVFIVHLSGNLEDRDFT